jgi:hypothetical protein
MLLSEARLASVWTVVLGQLHVWPKTGQPFARKGTYLIQTGHLGNLMVLMRLDALDQDRQDVCRFADEQHGPSPHAWNATDLTPSLFT